MWNISRLHTRDAFLGYRVAISSAHAVIRETMDTTMAMLARRSCLRDSSLIVLSFLTAIEGRIGACVIEPVGFRSGAVVFLLKGLAFGLGQQSPAAWSVQLVHRGIE